MFARSGAHPVVSGGRFRCLVTLTQHNSSLAKSQTRAINLFLQHHRVAGSPCNSPQKEEVVGTTLKGVPVTKVLLKEPEFLQPAVCSPKLVIENEFQFFFSFTVN
jgi:hypothetical protein